jgi:tripartite-type tricarboxylate transporter receptor subunit TctC
MLLSCFIPLTGLFIPFLMLEEAGAQQFPAKTISIITNVGPGSNFDQLGRVFAERLRQKLGVPVVFENLTGGQGVIAAQRVLTSKSDGHTLLIAGSGLATTPVIMKNAGYKADDFVALAPLGQVPFILYVSSAVPATDIPSMMSYLKANVKDVNSGILTTSHVTRMLSRKFGKAAGGELTEIGYRSSPQMLIGLLANDIQMMSTTHAVAGEHVASGKIKAIGVVAEERTQSMPDLPTFKEKDHPLIINVWECLFAKADVPADVLAKIREVSKEIVSDPSYLKAMVPTGMEPWNIPFESVQSAIDNEAKAFIAEAQELKIKFE